MTVLRIARQIIAARPDAASGVSAEDASRLWDAKLTHIVAMIGGGRPSEAILAESIAFDLASLLVRSGGLPPALYGYAVDVLGQETVAEIIYLVGLQSMVANAFRPDPSRDAL